jgi:hypothetical protein
MREARARGERRRARLSDTDKASDLDRGVAVKQHPDLVGGELVLAIGLCEDPEQLSAVDDLPGAGDPDKLGRIDQPQRGEVLLLVAWRRCSSSLRKSPSGEARAKLLKKVVSNQTVAAAVT